MPPTTPLYRRGDVVYLSSSAQLGKLEAFRITELKYGGVWYYGIDIYKKPPAQQLIGDSFDARIAEPRLYYIDSELISLCEAITIALGSLTSRINTLTAKAADCNSTDAEPPPTLEPDQAKYDVGDIVYFDASARLGFVHPVTILEINEVGIQPGSRRTRYRYKVNLRSKISLQYDFREDELLTLCEAYVKALASLERQHSDLLNKQTQHCASADITGSDITGTDITA